MGRHRDDDPVREADRLRAGYLAAYNGGDLETALRIGAEQLVPLAETLADDDERYHDQLGMTLRNLALISYRLGLRIGAFHFMQRAFHSAMLLEERKLPMNESLRSVATETVEFAADVAGGSATDLLPEAERELIVPAAALVPRSIELMGRIDSIKWASRMRVAASVLRMLGPHENLHLVDHESRAMVWLARLGFARGNRDLAVGEIRDALELWIEQLDAGPRFWSSQLQQTWTVAAELLDSMALNRSAVSIREALYQARQVRSREPSAVAAALDLRVHYRAALAALPRSA